jgi:hypothetical protein
LRYGLVVTVASPDISRIGAPPVTLIIAISPRIIGERGNAQNEREGSHQDRAKARTGGVHSGFAGGDTFLFLLARELDDQDGVLGSQADENNEADLRQDVDGHAPREQACD